MHARPTPRRRHSALLDGLDAPALDFDIGWPSTRRHFARTRRVAHRRLRRHLP